MGYIGQIWRPPSEANSLILQVTVGCSHNLCTFCVMYKEKEFYVKSIEEIKIDINQAVQLYPAVRRIFLADGDALIMPTDDLLAVLKLLYSNFPRLTRVTAYAGPDSILKKSNQDLQKLREAGLKMVYLGLESGSAKILQKVKKGATPQMISKAGQKLREAGLKSSVTVILGLGGQELSTEHAKETAHVINVMQPNFLSALTLMLRSDTPIYQEVLEKKITLLTPLATIQELYHLINQLDLSKPCIFRSNHASNYIAVAGTLPKDKAQMLSDLTDILKNPCQYNLKDESNRRL